MDPIIEFDDRVVRYGLMTFVIYPTEKHWVLINESSASSIVTKLCPLTDGLEKAKQRTKDYLHRNFDTTPL